MIYVISAIDDRGNNSDYQEEDASFRRVRCSAYCLTLEEAKAYVEADTFDLSEGGTNRWAVIEETPPGPPVDVVEKAWYRYNRELKRYELLCRPKKYEGICNWGIG